jgi:uncharacterized protein YecE (DUF72 family)
VKIHIGTSGWAYPHWKGTFYPEGLRSKDWLVFCAGQFDSIELNVTFYRQIKAETFQKWHDTVPEGFVFSAKMSRFITHIKRLRVDIDSISRFLTSVSVLAEKLGIILIQLPPSLAFDQNLTSDFFDLLDPHLKYAVEVRNASYENERFFEMLRKRNMSLCISETAGRFPYRETITADFIYMRLHGREDLYISSYRDDELSGIREKLIGWGKDTYVYFDNDFQGYAPKNALTLKTMVGG